MSRDRSVLDERGGVLSGQIHALTAELVDTGTLRPVIDRTYPLADTAAGLQHIEAGHARGKVVITVT